MKKILFATDFSECARNAFVYALELAKKINAEIIALHVYQLPDLKRLKKLPNTVTEVYNDIEFEEFENFRDDIPILRKIAAEHDLSHVKLSHLLEKGHPIRTISKVAKRENADFLIMGTRGSSAIKSLVVGSVTSGVIATRERIILSVHCNAEFDGIIDDIIFLTRNREVDGNALARVIQFAQQFDQCRIHCVNIESESNSSKAEFKNWQSKFVPDYPHLDFKSVRSYDALYAFGKEMDVDIIALLPKKKKWYRRRFGNSISLKLSHETQVPIMTLPDLN